MGFRGVEVATGRKGKSEDLSVKEQESIGSEEAALVSAEGLKSMYTDCEGIRSHCSLHHLYRTAGYSQHGSWESV